MYVKQLELVDFRSYPQVRLDLAEGPCVFVGGNGHGKTNLVESLVYLSNLRSHRVSTDAPLVRAGKDQAIVRAEIVHDERRLIAELAINPGKANQARLGRHRLTRPRDLLGALRAIAFAPEDLSLIRGEPSHRRRFLDELLTARNPRFAGVRADYEKVLKQRNTLLRTAYLARKTGGKRTSASEMGTLEAWDAHLSQLGAELLTGRLALLGDLTDHVANAYATIADGRNPASLVYTSSLDGEGQPLVSAAVDAELIAARMSAALAAGRDRELDRGTTLVGPHRDDLMVNLGELPAKGYASHGETWSAALAMRLGAYELLRCDGIAPVLILDDVFAELDEVRRRNLADMVASAPQTLITCAVVEDVPAKLTGARFDVWDGEVTRVV
ncbi:DNA replication/repair protein RecF [Natronoglycomyces albus]|uniref:DNA replication and repair protein RecF n=1 Tax=Natronoglycomyces albus TaxID=2811108 RepID=A0A895XS39_9ACTN|nr:DNA replication/repair protein RecF [Natronoglycomyces albus]QSB05376.1 DNA replication/repair protein RecF [Natronoglycomyces albus]